METEKKHSHSIHQRGIAFKIMGGFLPNMIKKIIEGKAKDKNLQNLLSQVSMIGILSRGTYRVHIAHITRVDKTSRLYERYLGTVSDAIHVVGN